MSILSIRRRNPTAVQPPRGNRFFPTRDSRMTKDGTCVYARSPKSDFRYRRPETSASRSYAII
eukprot:1852994-Pleurochrysis_carterae.AAC.1